jgi:hypothetical protein
MIPLLLTLALLLTGCAGVRQYDPVVVYTHGTRMVLHCYIASTGDVVRVDCH